MVGYLMEMFNRDAPRLLSQYPLCSAGIQIKATSMDSQSNLGLDTFSGESYIFYGYRQFQTYDYNGIFPLGLYVIIYHVIDLILLRFLQWLLSEQPLSESMACYGYGFAENWKCKTVIKQSLVAECSKFGHVTAEGDRLWNFKSGS